MQPSRFIRQTIFYRAIHSAHGKPADRGSTLHSSDSPNRVSQIRLFATQGNQESRLRITARRSLHAGTFPNEVRLEKPVAPPPKSSESSAACRKFVSCFSCTWSWRRDLNP